MRVPTAAAAAGLNPAVPGSRRPGQGGGVGCGGVWWGVVGAGRQATEAWDLKICLERRQVPTV